MKVIGQRHAKTWASEIRVADAPDVMSVDGVRTIGPDTVTIVQESNPAVASGPDVWDVVRVIVHGRVIAGGTGTGMRVWSVQHGGDLSEVPGWIWEAWTKA